MRKYLILFLNLTLTTVLIACNKDVTSSADNQEIGQQIGDAMASVDEAGTSSGSIAMNELKYKNGLQKAFLRLNPRTPFMDSIIPQAFATTCSSAPGFGACSSNTITRNFSGCTLGGATFNGSVNLAWGGGTASNCTMMGAGDYITHVPDITVTGLRNSTLAITKTGPIGQRITWASGAGASKVFQLTNDGIRRVFSLNGTTLFDFTTKTTSAITVTGTSRSSRIMNGGVLEVTNNVSGNVCTFSPTNVTWSSANCNCPVQGSWSGSCTQGESTTLTLSGCGAGTLTMGSDSQDISFDRCSGT